jgi:hypothetical protein
MHVTNDIPLGCLLFLPVHTANRVQTLKASWMFEVDATATDGEGAQTLSWTKGAFQGCGCVNLCTGLRYRCSSTRVVSVCGNMSTGFDHVQAVISASQ